MRPAWRRHGPLTPAETLIDKAIALHAIGGVYERQTPTPFMCLLLRLLQLQPEKEILFEYLLAEEFKYLRALAVMYIRLTFRSMEVYEILEPLMRDYRKLRYRQVGESPRQAEAGRGARLEEAGEERGWPSRPRRRARLGRAERKAGDCPRSA